MPLSDDLDLTVRKLLVPTYPAPWRGFTDITRVMERDPAAFRALVEEMLAPHRADPPDAVVAVESCGYVFGAPMAYELGSRLILARRAGKLPRPTLRHRYRAVGIGPAPDREMEVHTDAIVAGMRVLVVDDVLASGGTVLAALDLVQRAQGVPCAVSVAVELVRFDARASIRERRVPLFAALRL
ncbi:MAG TPA: phosphoribosyltransferase family protein [Chloroflexota bacterium]|nr:phosphoribosyltransferase family protein [Chloroflexota bacterium]